MKSKAEILFTIFLFLLCSVNSFSQSNSTTSIQRSVNESDYVNIVLCRPTDKSITISLLPLINMSLYFEYRKLSENYSDKTEIKNVVAGIPLEVVINNLYPNMLYNYRIRYRQSESDEFLNGEEHSFHTQRSRGSSFVFTIETDPHLYDKKGSRSLMKIALQNQLKDIPDFLLDLGDTFGDDHRPFEITNDEIRRLHLNYRPILGAICPSVPFLFCIGNHEGEFGYYLSQTPPTNIAVFATLARKYYFPNPVPDDFYSGNSQSEEFGIGVPENYYSWEWGDALFIVLDAYRYFTGNAKPRGWEWTLGKEQYEWFEQTLEKSNAKYKFVFTHHLLGQVRGGILVAKYFEWGGYSQKDVWEFDQMRPGWSLPVHQLMAKNGVTVFFQGHDHLFAKEELDGIVYQEVPMPSDSTYVIGTRDNGDAYTGVKIDASGHLRVTVSSSNVTVDYVRAWLPADETVQHKNGEIAYTYTVFPKPTLVASNDPMPAEFVLEQNYPNPFNPGTTISFSLPKAEHVTLKIYNSLGQDIKTLVDKSLTPGNYSYQWNANSMASGVYFYQLITPKYAQTRKALYLK